MGIIKGLNEIVIVSPFGNRTRKGKREFHPGVDIRVFDKAKDPYAKNILPIIAPEKIKISEINFSPEWGHWLKAKPVEPNELNIIEFQFWHVTARCNPGDIINEGGIIGIPEPGFVPLHLHFETRVAAVGGTSTVDPVPYLKLRNIKIKK